MALTIHLHGQFESQTLAINGTLKEADPQRYSVHFFEPGYYGSILQINNALKSDDGFYQCSIEYNKNGAPETVSAETEVTITLYLPAPDYPICTVPSLTLVVGSRTTFTCEAGESFPPIVILLQLQRQDGTLISHTEGTLTMPITHDDDGAIITCLLTSQKFPDFKRMCSAGPLTIVETTSDLPPSSPLMTSSLMLPSVSKFTSVSSLMSQSMPTSLSTSQMVSSTSSLSSTSSSRLMTPSSSSSQITPSGSPSQMKISSDLENNVLIWSIIGALLGTILILFFITLTICRIRRLKSAKSSEKSNETRPLEILAKKPSMADHEYNETPRNHGYDDTDLESLGPTYAELHKGNTLKFAQIMDNTKGKLKEIDD